MLRILLLLLALVIITVTGKPIEHNESKWLMEISDDMLKKQQEFQSDTATIPIEATTTPECIGLACFGLKDTKRRKPNCPPGYWC